MRVRARAYGRFVAKGVIRFNVVISLTVEHERTKEEVEKSAGTDGRGRGRTADDSPRLKSGESLQICALPSVQNRWRWVLELWKVFGMNLISATSREEMVGWRGGGRIRTDPSCTLLL